MSTTTHKARHRKAARPVTPLTVSGPVARRGLAVAASSGLALTMITSGATAANGTEIAASAGSLEAAGTSALAAEAREVITTNEAVTVAAEAAVPADVTAVAEATVEAPVVEPEVVEEDTTAASASTGAADESASSTTNASATVAGPSNASGVVAIAMQYVGLPYVYGASGPSAFDCSGLVQYVYAQAGISLPRTSYAQGAAGVHVSAAEAQPGDIVYYGGHVGIYAGNGMMIDAGTPDTGVVYRAVWGTPSYYVHIG